MNPAAAQARVVVVTGTSRGLGEGIARRLLADGYRVTGVARGPAPAALGEGYCHVRADLADIDAIPAIARDVVRRQGAPYGLVNNAAGALEGMPLTLGDVAIRDALHLDLLSPLLLTKYLARPMVAAGCGRVVNVSSIVASTGFRGLAIYGAAKAGLEGYTRCLARDLGRRGVTVNAVAPGFLETAMSASLGTTDAERVRGRSPLRRFATVQEVAAAVAYLLSPDADGVTGTVLTVDAGATA